jgi:uncharacterized protein YjbI with pentapeptide repeats
MYFDTVAASSVRLVKNGVDYSHAKLKGPFQADSTQFGSGGYPTTFEGAEFYSSSEFIGTVFHGTASFRSTNFRNTYHVNWTEALSPAEAFLRIADDDPIQVSFFNTEFRKSADFSRATFDQLAYFDGDAFFGPAAFDKSDFKASVRFKDTRFGKQAGFHYTVFRGNIFFDQDTLAGCDFGGAKFYNDGDFSRSVYVGKLYFGQTDFYNEDIFTSRDTVSTTTVFYSDADFRSDEFLDSVVFYYASFRGATDFTDALFTNYAAFRGMALTPKSRLDFTNAVLPDTLDLSENHNLPISIDLTTANFTDPTRYDSTGKLPYRRHAIYLYKSDISKFHLDYAHFRLITDSTLGVPRKKITEDDAEGMYEALLNNFKSLGQNESYKLLDIEYQKFKWQHSWASWLVWLPESWWNFGYDKEYVFRWTGWLLVVFTAITSLFVDYLNTGVYAMNNIPIQGRPFDKKLLTTISKLAKRVWYSFVYSANIFFRLTIKVENIYYNKFWGTLYVMLMYTLGLICLAYMANFVLQK